MINSGGTLVESVVDVGVVDLKEWSSGPFGAYICCLNGGF